MLNAHPILVRGITFLSREPRLKLGSPQITPASCQVPIPESRHRQLANCRLQEGNEQKFPQRTKDSRHSSESRSEGQLTGTLSRALSSFFFCECFRTLQS